MVEKERMSSRTQPKMVARIWRGRVKSAQADEYTDYLYRNGLRHMQGIDGNLGTQMLKKAEGEVTEFLVISYWDIGKAQSAIKKITGGETGKSWLLEKDREYLVDANTSVAHYDVLVDDWVRTR
ncbi:MAG TPA: hypothetical protein VEJ16_09230 [Alphaproteobacteria bacterium]|nr:hypothetical protein [Alphaproteobacteria bacterium]